MINPPNNIPGEGAGKNRYKFGAESFQCRQLTFVMHQEVEMLVGVDVTATGSHVDVDRVRQRRVKMSTTSITATDPVRPRRP